MKTLLQLNTSIFSNAGQSSHLTEQFVKSWHANNSDARIVERDLAKNPVPHLDAERFQSFLAKPEERDAKQQSVVNYSDSLIEEIRRADVIVLGLPMYNFGVPSTLKAYFDHIARAGVTFRYTEKGPIGLLTGKKVYVFATRGGLYAGTPLDSQTTYVRDFFKFLGIDDVEFIYAEGLAMSDVAKQTGLKQAHNAIQRLNTLELAAA